MHSIFLILEKYFRMAFAENNITNTANKRYKLLSPDDPTNKEAMILNIIKSIIGDAIAKKITK